MNKEKTNSTPIIITAVIIVILIGVYFVISSDRTNLPPIEAPASGQTSTPVTVPPIPISTSSISVSPASINSTSSALAAPTSSAPAITSNLKISRPAGGEQWKAGDDYVVRWTGQDFTGSDKEDYNFELSLMQGDRGKGIVVSVDNAPMDGASYLWTIPKDTPPGTYEIVIVESRLVPCPFSASSTLCRVGIFQSYSNPFSIISPGY